MPAGGGGWGLSCWGWGCCCWPPPRSAWMWRWTPTGVSKVRRCTGHSRWMNRPTNRHRTGRSAGRLLTPTRHTHHHPGMAAAAAAAAGGSDDEQQQQQEQQAERHISTMQALALMRYLRCVKISLDVFLETQTNINQMVSSKS